jgi:FKBP-type peptidyl-prolyl cis-trans isomerase FklB
MCAMKYGLMLNTAAIGLLSLSLACANAFAADSETTTSTSTTITNTGTAPAMSSAADQNKVASDAFLATNKTKPGVVTLPDGLQYKVIGAGKGAQPAATDTVTVNYAGRLIDGTEFDSSYKRGQPAMFPVNGVIAGWVEALQLMKAGSVWELYIPASLAYGEQGAPPVIGPNQALIFKVELLDVKKS